MRKLIVLAIAFALIFPFSSLAAYPAKPIKLIVPSKAGGSTDTTARLFIKSAKKYWPDADFVIKNVGGSGGQKGFEEIASARPNGYTFGMVFTTQVVAHIVSKRARYTLDSFRVLGNSMQDPLIVAVTADSPYHSLDA
jgi:tripartite-type tricarboxylate transporter receptor subunit TctC